MTSYSDQYRLNLYQNQEDSSQDPVSNFLQSNAAKSEVIHSPSNIIHPEVDVFSQKNEIYPSNFQSNNLKISIGTPEFHTKRNSFLFPISWNDKGKSLTLNRTYRHFSFLRNSLVEEFPGCIIPVLPPYDSKIMITKLPFIHKPVNEQSLRSRRKILEKFLNEIISIPILWESNPLKNFLNLSLDEYDALAKSSPLPETAKNIKTQIKTIISNTISTKNTDEEVGMIENECKRNLSNLINMKSQLKKIKTNQKKLASSFTGLSKALAKDDANASVATLESSLTLKNILIEEKYLIDNFTYFINLHGDVFRAIADVRNSNTKLKKLLNSKVKLSNEKEKLAKVNLSRDKLSQKKLKKHDEEMIKNQMELDKLERKIEEERVKDEEIRERFQNSYQYFLQRKEDEVPKLISQFIRTIKKGGEMQVENFSYLS